MEAGVIVLSGGKSSRMGRNKALLPVGQQTAIEKIITELEPICQQPIIVTNDPAEYAWLELPLVSDEYPGKGPLAGIQAGLKASTFETNFVVACDMPFASVTIAREIIRFSEGYDACVPEVRGKLHPLFAAYQKRCLPALDQCLRQDRLRVIDLLNRIHVHYVREDDLCTKERGQPQQLVTEHIDRFERAFFNMNRPDEYERAKKWLTES